jgi:hypothetical protein
MTNLAKTGEIIEKVLRKFMEEKFEREWVGLTDDEVTELFCDYDGSQFPAFVRAIEAKLKEKNHD